MHNQTRRAAQAALCFAMAYLVSTVIALCPGIGNTGMAYAATDKSFVPPTVDMTPPIYPPSAYRNLHSGTVTLMLLVAASGNVVDIKIEKSSGYRDLDKAAIDQARTWGYKAARRGGVPIDAYARVPINFSLGNRRIDRGLDLDCSTEAAPMMHSHILRPECTVQELLMGPAESTRIHPGVPASWQRMTNGMGGSREWYIDEAAAMRSGKTSYFWAKQVLDTPARHDVSILTMRVREYAFDCDTRQIASMLVWYYDAAGVPWTADGGEPSFSVPPQLAKELEGMVCAS